MPFQTRHDREICEGLRASCRQQCSEGGVADALGAGQWRHLAWGASDDATVEHSVAITVQFLEVQSLSVPRARSKCGFF